MGQAVIYFRVSTIDQTTANQERELRQIAGRIPRPAPGLQFAVPSCHAA
jgi:hypothetical protein